MYIIKQQSIIININLYSIPRGNKHHNSFVSMCDIIKQQFFFLSSDIIFHSHTSYGFNNENSTKRMNKLNLIKNISLNSILYLYIYYIMNI